MITFFGHKYFSGEKSRDPDSVKSPHGRLGSSASVFQILLDATRKTALKPFFLFVRRVGFEPT